MKVILLEDIAKIGKKFDIKEVSNGYALNFLFPKKQAKMATAQAMKEIEETKKKHEAQMKVDNEKLLEIVNKLKEEKFEIVAKTNEEGGLFAGIDKKEIAKIISEKAGIKVGGEIIELKSPLKEVGEHEIVINIEDAKVKLTVEVKAE